uniref:Uncharacterized protein n=1 Tax=Tanacetum cinerariifolium TaxID=118510 RepID=A0A6L2KQ19_TANCI|nr:hypothetical protein [Tanacetum cinerariifolium]
MYKEYLTEFWYSAKALENSKVYFSTSTCGIYGEVGINTFRKSTGAHYLHHSSKYVAPPSIHIVRPWFETIRYEEAIPAKGTLKKSLLPPRWSITNGINIDYANIFWEDIIIKMNKKHREKVMPYDPLPSYALKPNQPEEPPIIDHILAICVADTLVVFKAPRPSSIAERVAQGTKPGAKPGHKKHLTIKQSSVSSKEATKGGSSKAPIGSKTCHFKKRKESSSAIDSNLSQPPVFKYVDTGMHKEDQQATGGSTSLGVTISTAKTDLRNSAPSDFVPQQQGMNKGTKNTSCDHLFTGTDLQVLADQTKSVSEGLETVLIQPITGKRASFIARQVEEEEASSIIKLEYLAKLVSHMQPRFKDLDSPEDDPVIVVDDSDEVKDIKEKDKVRAKTGQNQEQTGSVEKSKMKPDKVKAHPPHINHHCCYECGDPLDGIFCKRCTSKEGGRRKANWEEQAAKARFWKIPICYDDDEDYTIAITPKEPDNSLIMGDEHLDTILGEHECDVPACDDFTTFSNLLFDVDDDFSSSDDESFSDEDISKKIYSNPLFDEEIISIKIDPHHFNVESDLIESLINQDSSIISSSLKIDSLLDEFAGELILLKSIPPGIDKADCDPKEEIRLVERLLYDNSSPRPSKEFNSENSDAIIESFSPSLIHVEDSDPFMEEIDLFLDYDGTIPLKTRLLLLSFDFVFSSEISKSVSFCLDRLCNLAILCLDHHAHTLHHLESLLTISLDRHYILRKILFIRFEHEHVVMNPTLLE